MFTGIVQGLGRLMDIKPVTGEIELTVEADFDWDGPLVEGESIAVSGACLTVTKGSRRAFTAFVSAETVSKTTLREAKRGTRVNLERALRLSDRLGGHLVTGHVDGLGRIFKREERGQSIVYTFGMDGSLIQYVVAKGSVAVDGVSLTVNEVGPDRFQVNLIPQTAMMTTLGFKRPGEYVNLETDLIGKYVARFLGRDTNVSKIDMKFLAENGFL